MGKASSQKQQIFEKHNDVCNVCDWVRFSQNVKNQNVDLTGTAHKNE